MPRRLIIGARVSGAGAVYTLARVRGELVRCPMTRRVDSEWAVCGVPLPPEGRGELDLSLLCDPDPDTHIRAVHVRVAEEDV